MSTSPPREVVTVIIPARNEARRIARAILAVQGQAAEAEIEILVADDGSDDDTAVRSIQAGATVLRIEGGGNPAIARNQAARQARGSILLFLDADCVPQPQWLARHLQAQAAGAGIVGGALALPAGLGWSARADYYASAYHVHPGRKGGVVPNHPPANLSVRRSIFAATSGFTEQFPIADGHEELAWQAVARQAGWPIQFAPDAIVDHWNRRGLGNLMRRSYRWGYSALEAKRTTGAGRVSGLYRFPALAMAAAYPLAVIEAGYIIGIWLKAGQVTALQFLPVILIARLVYATALVVGGWRWLRRNPATPGTRSRWR